MSKDPNAIVNAIFKGLRDAIPANVDYSKGLPNLDFSEPERDFLFYGLKHGPDDHYWLDKAAFLILQKTPHMVPEDEPIEEGFYEELISPKKFPEAYQKCTSPLDCFLKNAPALCKHISDNVAELDLDYLSSYAVKEGFQPYGGKATLNITNGVYELEKVENANAAGPEEALHIFFSSFAIHVVFERHAVMTHLSVAQRLLIKFTYPNDETKVNNNPRLKSLLQVLTTRVNEVSINEHLLIGKNSLVARASSFTNYALIGAGQALYEMYAQMSPTDLVTLLGDGSKQWEEAVNTGWQAAQKLIQDLELPVDASDAELLALDVWVSSFYHQFIGNLQLDNLIKGNLPFPCTGKPHEQTKDYAIKSTTIAVTTMTRTYSVLQVPALIDQKDQKSIAAWKEYGEVLASLDTGIDQFIGSGAYAAVNF
ncbi:MAG: hypothetical protein L3J28_11065 [Candidatus Polarisedimenticolaceae bacterium]|nr:hypothetical protein [Candidatus Polarisedimenticolaceae bacterium]